MQCPTPSTGTTARGVLADRAARAARLAMISLVVFGAPAALGAGDPSIPPELADMKFDTMPEPPPSLDGAHKIGRALTQLLYAGEIDALWENFGPGGRRQMGSAAGLAAFASRLKGDFGVEKRMIAETETKSGALTVYKRASQFTRYARGVDVEWTYDEHAMVSQVAVRPSQSEAPTPYLSYKTRTPLRLPFDDRWLVLWGGRTVAVNRHASVSDQRFAYDLFISRDGSTCAGDCRRNEQYHCFGRALLAPAPGTVVVVVSDIADNAPGSVNPEQLFGNHVVIDHGNGEYSMLAHMMKGSIVVARGQRVKAGETIGRTGNSGTSTEPHLHYQLMDSADYLHAKGMPAQFLDYVANGAYVARGEPVHGDFVEHKGPTANH